MNNITSLKIATHNSATGEKARNFFSWLMIPFSRTQSKTIKEQYTAGCRMFDIRIRYSTDGDMICAHGLFETKRSANDILNEIESFPEKCYVFLTYEGMFETHSEIEKFKDDVKNIQQKHSLIAYGATAIKYSNPSIVVDYNYILPATAIIPAATQGFLPLNGKNWQTWIPLPWLWKKIYFNKPKFNNETFTFVDFL